MGTLIASFLILTFILGVVGIILQYIALKRRPKKYIHRDY